MNIENRIRKLEAKQRNYFFVTIQKDAQQTSATEPDKRAGLWLNINVTTIPSGTVHKVKDLGTIERRRAENEY